MKSIKRYSKRVGNIRNTYSEIPLNPFTNMEGYPLNNNPYIEIQSINISARMKDPSGYDGIMEIYLDGYYSSKKQCSGSLNLKVRFVGELLVTTFIPDQEIYTTQKHIVKAEDIKAFQCEEELVEAPYTVYLYVDNYTNSDSFTVEVLKYNITLEEV